MFSFQLRVGAEVSRFGINLLPSQYRLVSVIIPHRYLRRILPFIKSCSFVSNWNFVTFIRQLSLE